jgi:hypothetical protein
MSDTTTEVVSHGGVRKDAQAMEPFQTSHDLSPLTMHRYDVRTDRCTCGMRSPRTPMLILFPRESCP